MVDQGCDERTLAYVLSLPREQRAAAYLRLCGQLPPGALGFDAPSLGETGKWLAYSAAAVVGIVLWRKYVRTK